MSRLPSQAEYERNERAEAQRHEREVDAAPLSERKENQATFLQVMRRDPEAVAERIDWLLAGNYGFGAMMMARNTTSRMNRPALFTQLVAVFEWMCPRRMAVDAWKRLSSSEKARLQTAVEEVIEAYDRAVASGEG